MQSQKTENYAKADIKAPLHHPAPPDPATMPDTPPTTPPPKKNPTPISHPRIARAAHQISPSEPIIPQHLMKTPERHHLRRFGIFMINSGLTSHPVLVFPLLIPKQVTNSCKTGAMLQSNTENQVAKMVLQK